MKLLLLVRHAKSSWDGPAQADHDRPLNDRGRRDAPMMAQRLAARGLRPDLLVSSTALRARATAEAFAQELGVPAARLQLEQRLYEATPARLMDVVHGLDDSLGCVLLFAHNPGLSELALRLSGGAIASMPTCGVAEFGFAQGRWADLGRHAAQSVAFDFPKDGR